MESKRWSAKLAYTTWAGDEPVADDNNLDEK